MVDVDVICPQPAKAGLTGLNQVIARRTNIVRAIAHTKGRFRRDENRAPTPSQRFAQDLFRGALRINVGRVKEIDSCIETDIDKPRCLADVAIAPSLEKISSPSEGTGAKAENRDL